MRIRVPRSPLRLLRERYFGEKSRNPWVARNALANLSERLPPEVIPIVSEAVNSLIDYQDPDYALLYLDRIERYVGPAGITFHALGELAQLLSARMKFEDPIRIAQLKLVQAGGAEARPDPSSTDRIERFRWDEIIPMLPPSVAAPALSLFARLRLARLVRRSVTLRFSSASRFRLQRVKWLASLRGARPLSQRYKLERTWVERWLHMVDRSIVMHPEAAVEVVRTAELIKGHGDVYQNGLSQWNVIIDDLVKPTCDGVLSLPALGNAVKEARQVSPEDHKRLMQVVGCLKMQGLAQG